MDDNNLTDYEILQVGDKPADIFQIDAIEKANVDIQVSTAKQYPRDIRRCVDNSVVLATMNLATAQTCGYALPRGGKPITGPSVHLAKILVSNWGNMRTEAKVVQITDRQIISRGTAWDLETNVASAFEVRRSIVGKDGKRFSDDMITVTGNAANSIAYRNAVFAVIPKGIVDRVYSAAQKMITGDLSNCDLLLKKRTEILNTFKNDYKITEEEVIKICGKETVNQINSDSIALLIGTLQSLKDGDTNVADLMKPIREQKLTVEEKKSQLKGKDKPLLP